MSRAVYTIGRFIGSNATSELAEHYTNAGFDAETEAGSTGSSSILTITDTITRRFTNAEAQALKPLDNLFTTTSQIRLRHRQELLFSAYLSLIATEMECSELVVPNHPVYDNLPHVEQIFFQQDRAGLRPILRGVYEGNRFIAIEGSHRANICAQIGRSPLVLDISAVRKVGQSDLDGFSEKLVSPEKLIAHVKSLSGACTYLF